jgi:P4 family phage/plasmid primase-like protien
MSIAPNENTVDENNATFNLKNYALDLFHGGFNVIPMRSDSKAPDGNWKAYTTRSQTEQEVLSFVWTQNIGIINGVHQVRTIDLDQCDSPDVLFNLLIQLGLDYEYPWIVQSPGRGGGFHIYVLCDSDLTLTTNSVLVGTPKTEGDFKQIELRWRDCVTMFPPSIHPEAHEPYIWLFGVPQTPIAHLSIDLVEKAFKSVAVPQKKTQETHTNTMSTQAAQTTNQIPQTPQKGLKFDAWAQKALDQELGTLRATREGGRNAQLNKSSFALGQIIGADLLTRSDVEELLTRTASALGLSEIEIASTIKSGLDAGAKKPRMPKQVFKENEPTLTLHPKKVDDEVIASFTADDQGHAECVYHLFGDYLAYNDATGWVLWNGTHFVPSIQRINTIIIKVLRMRMKAASHLERTDLAKVSKAMAGTVSATRSMLENLAFVNVEEFDAEPDLINTLNGIVNMRNRKLIPHDPSYRFTWCSPVRYNPQANGDLWLQFINETVENEDMVGYLQEALGYSLTGHTSEECLFYIFGPPRSGKGTLSETILGILPRPIAQEVDFNTFTQKREGDNQNFDLAPMKPARLIFASESNKYQSLNPAKVKALTGGNQVTCAHKYGAFFSYRPQYAVWLSSNHEVNGDADDDALWGRVKVIHFPHSRLGHEDKSLKQRMQSTENLEFVLAWMVEGAYQWYQHEGQGLTTPKAVSDLTQAQRAGQDSVGLWLEECCELVADEWTENSKIMLSYTNWCEANGYEPKKAKGLSQSLASHGYEVAISKWIYQTPGTRVKSRGVQGLRLL